MLSMVITLPNNTKHLFYTALYLLTHRSNTLSSGVDALKIGDEAMLELLSHLISEPAFDQLRTKEQLGYIVHTGRYCVDPDGDSR